jgi:hypothetical protein
LVGPPVLEGGGTLAPLPLVAVGGREPELERELDDELPGLGAAGLGVGSLDIIYLDSRPRRLSLLCGTG